MEHTMSKDTAYRTVARHVFVAHQIGAKNGRSLIILADSLGEARKKAEIGFGDRKSTRLNSSHP